ncbi:MAG: hypothetical protein DMG02_10680 [Acidobacteria bacterium]|nr:MAG: hypothetical protein DMG02_10680 [Acidobacteriota bacterium]
MADRADSMIPLASLRTGSTSGDIRVLLIGPYDPHGGEYTFLAPPLGVWRLAGVLQQHGIAAEVFDPNCCSESPEYLLSSLIERHRWDVIGVSTTGMTLRYDLALAHLAKRLRPDACLIAGGMEATFEPETMLRLAPFDLVVLGEGEEPLLEIVNRLRARTGLENIRGTVWRDADGSVRRSSAAALGRDELKNSIFAIPYERMPYPQYWERLEESYGLGALPHKADREARLAEIRSVRLITLNYCPMRCTFCSSTNFLNAAQGSTAKIARLDAAECVSMIARIVAAQPGVRTVIFQDDIFVFRNDDRILPLCHAIVEAKECGRIPDDLRFISTNRIDAMSPSCLAAMRRAGFRVLGFGVESFSLDILREFNKAQIYPFIEPVLENALSLGITPFLDMILSSPHCELADVAENVRQAFKWTVAGCEVGLYPYVIPFSGAAMASDPALRTSTISTTRSVAGTPVRWEQAVKILPLDRAVRDAILRIEAAYEDWLGRFTEVVPHLPSRVRSLLWILSAAPVLERRGCRVPSQEAVAQALVQRVPETAATLVTLMPDEQHV